MGNINRSIGTLFLLGSILLIYLQPTEVVGYIMAICGIVLVLYPYGSGSDIKHVEREETRRD